MRVDTTRPTDAHKYDADDDLHLSEVDGYHDLVRALIGRAYQDARGNIGVSSYMTQERQRRVITDGVLFFKDGRCQHWCECIGIEDFRLLGL